MITTEKLRELNNILKETQIEIEELLRVRDNPSLFKNSDDYYVQLKACQYVPQDYFNARFFDTYIELKYSRKSKEFYIRIDTQKFEYLRYISYSEFIHENKLKQIQAYPNNLYISKDLSFENVCKIFYRYCALILSFYLSEEQLFFYK